MQMKRQSVGCERELESHSVLEKVDEAASASHHEINLKLSPRTTKMLAKGSVKRSV